MALRTPEAPEQENRIQETYQDGLNPHKRGALGGVYAKHQAEIDERQRSLRSSEVSPASFGDNEDIQSQEESGAFPGPWANKTAPQEPQQSRGGGWKGVVATAKRRGPLGILLTILIGGAVGVSFLTPGLLLVHVTETITDKLNMQFSSLDIRTNKVLSKKISNQALSGVCTQVVSVRCKFNSLNDRQLKSLRSAGVTVNLQENTTITGRHKPTSMSFNGKEVDLGNLSRQLQEDPELRSAFKSAYSSKFAGFADRTWVAAANKLKISKSPLLKPGMSTDEKNEAVKTATKEGRSTDTSGGKRIVQNGDGDWVYEDTDTRATDAEGRYIGDVTDSDGNSLAKQLADANNDSIDNASDIKVGIDEINESGKKSTGKALSAATEALDSTRSIDPKTLSAGIAGGLLAVPDAACSFYGMYRAVSFGAKTIRSGQMARYAMMYLTMGSMIKSGDATPEEVAYFGDLLTKTVQEEIKDAEGNISKVTSKAATDSYGYRYAAYGDTGPLTVSAAEFTAGGGLGGKMDGIANSILSALPGGQKETKKLCGVIKSPLGQAANVVLTIGVMLFGGPVGWGAVAASIGGSFAINQALSAAQGILTPILSDMVAGVLVDDTTFGEKAGDALVSGSGVIMSTVAGMGGNAPLKPEDAVAYMNTQQEVIAQYAEEERLARSPLDPTSRYTFMGRIVGQLVPYSSQAKTVSSFTATSFSVVKRSLATIFTPAAFAAENTIETYTQCDDMDYREINLATDPFCNPIRGIPPQYLDVDPDTVIDHLITNGFIDEENGQAKSDTDDTDSNMGKKYSEFVDDCINRTRPLGDSGENFDEDSGKKCFIEDGDPEDGDTLSAKDKAYIYIYHIDQRVLDGMENGFPAAPGGTGGGGARISEAQLLALIAEYGLDPPTADGVDGWQSKLEILTSNDKASWAAGAMLAAEKNFKDKGGDLKEYLNTAWLWVENGGSSWPDPYMVNCADIGEPDMHKITRHCSKNDGNGLFQVAGFQMWDRQNDIVKEYERFYSDGDLTSVLENVLLNSSNASKELWNYNAQSNIGLVGTYLGVVSSGSATINNIAPKGGDAKTDSKTQFLTNMLSKDPNMATALNSYAVSDSDLIPELKKTCLYNSCTYYGSAFKQLLSNMIYALWKYDSQFGGAEGGRGGGTGINAVWGGVSKSPSDEWGVTTLSASGYYDNYAGGLGVPGAHPGLDYSMTIGTKLYSPVTGKVVSAGGTCYFRDDENAKVYSNNPCSNGSGLRSFPGTGELKIEIKVDGATHELILGHMSKIDVKVGDSVSPGQYVGLSGTANNAAHLHIEYRIPNSANTSGQQAVDPRKYL